MKITDSRILVFDTETTGVDPMEARIVELGAVLVEGARVGRSMRSILNPGVPIPPEASAVHGITDDDVKDAATFEDIAMRVYDLLEHVDAVGGYNVVAYDCTVLEEELWRAILADRPACFDRALDPLVFVRYHLRHMRDRKLAAVAQHFGFRLENAHTAVADARAAWAVLSAMIGCGWIPDDLDEATRMQGQYELIEQIERDTWSYWIFESRDSDDLCIGCGKHIGKPLRKVPPGYLEYCLKLPDLPDAVRDEFSKAITRSRS